MPSPRSIRLLHTLPALLLWLIASLWAGCSSTRYASVEHAIRHEDYSRARAQLETDGPTDAQGWALLAECRLRQKDYLPLADAAVNSLRLSSEYRARIDYFLQQGFIEQVTAGVAAFNAGKDPEASRLFNQLLAYCQQIQDYLTPSMLETRQKISALAGAVSLRLRDYPNARAYLEGLKEEWKDSPILLERLALIYYQMGEPQLCLATCESLLVAQPRNTTILELRAQACQQLGEPIATVNAYRDALEQSPFSSVLHRNLGIILFGLGDWQQARSHLEAACSTQPADSLDLQVLIAECLYNEGDFEGALAHFEQVGAARPQDANVQRALGACYRTLGHRAEAEAAFRRARQLAADSIHATTETGDSLSLHHGGQNR